ncbi:MAG: 30S ribosome-binding factor RbfA [Phycisphaerales bacterium]|nr:30S ribosome-binding factor RbfA [Phycisphaerales bacterium]
MRRRTLQVASTVEKAVAEVLARGLSDPRAKGLITVTGIEVTDDFSLAKISVTIMPEEHEQITMHALTAAAGFIRREAMKHVHLRDMPHLSFHLDTGLKNQARVFELLNKVAEEREARSEHPQAPRADEENQG